MVNTILEIDDGTEGCIAVDGEGIGYFLYGPEIDESIYVSPIAIFAALSNHLGIEYIESSLYLTLSNTNTTYVAFKNEYSGPYLGEALSTTDIDLDRFAPDYDPSYD